MIDVDAVMDLGPVIPVLVIEDVGHARPIAEALVAGGIYALEVTLRTPHALDAIRAMRDVPGAVVGAGTVLNAGDLRASVDAGAEFIVSPGLTPRLIEAAQTTNVAFLPGIASASDIMLGLERGLTRFKFFPAEASGGIKALSALAAPLFTARFCPTGGISLATAPQWLALAAVKCVGGSWLVPKGPPDLRRIETAAREAAALTR